MPSNLQIFLFNLQNTYLTGFTGQFIRLENEAASEIITNSAVSLIQVDEYTYSVQLVFKTWFGTRVFSQDITLSTPNDVTSSLKAVEEAVQQMAVEAQAQINNPQKEADTVGG